MERLKATALGVLLYFLCPVTFTVAQEPTVVTLNDLEFNFVNEGSNRWGVIEIVDGTHVLLPCDNDGLPTSRMAEDTAKECLVKYIMLYHDVVPKREFRAISYEMVRLDYNEAAAQTMRVIAGPQGVNSEYPDGSEPTGGTSCSATWTSVAIGDGTEECEEVSATAVTLTGSGTNEYTGYAFAYKTESSASDMQFDVTMPVTSSWTGTNENFTMGGCMFREGTAANDYNFFGARAFGSAMLYKAVENQALITNGTGTAGTGLPRQVRCWYDHSASELKAFEYNGSSWDQIDVTVSKGLTFPVLYGAFVTSHTTASTTTIPITAMTYTTTLDTGGGGPAPPIDRTVQWRCDFEDGQLNPRSDGSLNCSTAVNGMDDFGNQGDLTITNITNANPAVITYSGTDPANGDAFLISGVGGMTQINDQLVYVRSINAGANTFEAAVTNWPLWSGNGGQNVATLIANNAVNSTTYSSYVSGGTLEAFADISFYTDTGGGRGPASGYTNRVLDSGSDTIGADSNVPCREGDYCWRNEIHYNWPNFSNSKNKPRSTLNPPTASHYDWDVPFWTGFSIYIPSDACNDTGSSQQGNSMYTVSGDSASQDMLQLRYGRPSPNGSTTNWQVSVSVNTQSGNQNTIGIFTLAEATKGKWHDFVVYQDANASTGDLIIWHNTSDGNGEAGTTPVKVYEKLDGYGNLPIAGSQVRADFRQYYYTWKHQATACQVNRFAIGYDAIYTGAVADGTTSSDVHPGGQSVSGGPSP